VTSHHVKTDSEPELEQKSDAPEKERRGAAPAERSTHVYAPPSTISRVLQFDAVPSHRQVRATETSRDHVLLRVSPSADAAATLDARAAGMPRLNIAVVMDRSGSMEGSGLEQAKRACSTLLDMLRPDDTLTVIAYSETADLVLPARHITNKALIRETLSSIKSGTTTNLLLGLRAAAQQLMSVKDNRTLNRIFLVTDGEPAAGVKEYAAIMTAASDLAGRGITITTFGLGTDYEEELLAGIAERAGGNYYHVPEPGLIAAAFEREFRQTTQVCARNLRLRLHPSRGVNILRVFGRDAVYTPTCVELTLSDLERNRSIELVCELEFTQRPAAQYRVLRAELLYDDTGTLCPERLTCELTYEFVAADASVDEANSLTTAAVEIASAIQILDMTILAIRRQGVDATEVQNHLRRVQETLRSKERIAEAESVASASAAIDRGVPMSKVLMSAVFDLDQGKTS